MSNNISKKIKELREQNNITQNKLANDLFIKQQTVAQWENGSRALKADSIISLAKYFNVSTDYLLGLTENKTCFSTLTVENILNLSAEHKIILDKIINELLKSDLLEKFEELKENNIKLINLYQTDSIYNKLVEDEELTYNTIDNADELNGKFIFKDEYSKLLLFEIKYIFFDIIRNLSEYNKMIELKKDSEKGYNED